MRIVISGDIPSKKNSRVVKMTGKRPILLTSKHYRIWHETAAWEVKSQSQGVMYENVSVVMTFHPKTKRKFDLTNKAESIMDLLVDVGVLRDDNWEEVYEVVLRFGSVDRQNPRAVVDITGSSVQ